MGRYELGSQHAIEAGRKGKPSPRTLSLARVRNELPPMDSPENVKRALETIRLWALAGLIPGTVLSGVVRLHEDWLKAHDSQDGPPAPPGR